MSRISATNGPSALENVSLEQDMSEALKNVPSMNESQDAVHSGSPSHIGYPPLQRTAIPPSSLPTTSSWQANAPGKCKCFVFLIIFLKSIKGTQQKIKKESNFCSEKVTFFMRYRR